MQILLSLLPRVSAFYSPPKTGWKHEQIWSLYNLVKQSVPSFSLSKNLAWLGSPGKAMLRPSVTSTLSVLYYSFFNSSSVVLILRWGLMVCNPQVPRGASGKDWAHIDNYPVFGNSVFCNPIPLLTISHFISIQTPESHCHCWSYPAPKEEIWIFIFSSEKLSVLIYFKTCIWIYCWPRIALDSAGGLLKMKETYFWPSNEVGIQIDTYTNEKSEAG